MDFKIDKMSLDDLYSIKNILNYPVWWFLELWNFKEWIRM